MSRARRPRDMLVRSEDLAHARSTVKKQGEQDVLEQLRAREPVLMRYLLGTWEEVYTVLRKKRQTAMQCEWARQRMRLALIVALTAQHRAHYRLWKQTSLGTLLERIDPSLAE